MANKPEGEIDTNRPRRVAERRALQTAKNNAVWRGRKVRKERDQARRERDAAWAEVKYLRERLEAFYREMYDLQERLHHELLSPPPPPKKKARKTP